VLSNLRSILLNKQSLTINPVSKDSLMLITKLRRMLMTRRNSLMMLLNSEKRMLTRPRRRRMRKTTQILKQPRMTKSNKSRILRKPSTSGSKRVSVLLS